MSAETSGPAGDESRQDPNLALSGQDYALTTCAAGAVLELRFKPERRVARLAGEDAARFRADFAVIVAQHPGWPADRSLAQLWDQGGYGWLSTEDEGAAEDRR
ncbi:hypothetical protein [Aquabacter spiritensis]|uniref:Uncharacterized protein n=1 Tax=Aquabacter spiritensis TaxID=933073 RepID=A0A4R3M3M1_9HYPH|nr:hypothetical protein [Aquabacter spiritensis]TCT07854.1 hypothetical protein EDC64_101373 [Aquabacter spiritensis]